MFKQHDDFATRLVKDELKNHDRLRADPLNCCKILVPYPLEEWVSLNLTPFAAQTQEVDAKRYFSCVKNVDELLNAYSLARLIKPFEEDIPHACDHITDYAAWFMAKIIKRSLHIINEEDASRIADLVSNLDLYTAVKAVESLLNSHADLVLLKIAENNGWTVHFDHLAIRCGCSERGNAEMVVDNLCRHHGYVSSQISSENYYRFDDGWDAYVLFKVLENGQQLRLFIDQSSVQSSPQIIQHWNYVYGYTAHHLALRVTHLEHGYRKAIPLSQLTASMADHNIKMLTATGHYTVGLLEQVFTKPELNTEIPEQIRQHLRKCDKSLEFSIENGKLLELLSRSEMSDELKPDYFALYGITFDNKNPLHSAPVYPYFLPTQAAHVIRTSIQAA